MGEDSRSRIVEAVIVSSKKGGHLIPIKGINGHGRDVHEELSKAGFTPGDKVVIVLAEDYANLTSFFAE